MNAIQISSLTPDDFKAIIAEILEESFIRHLKSPEPPQPRYYTRKETKELLRISYPTLNKWTKDGILRSYRIGSRLRYKSSEVEKAIREVNLLKYRRD